VRAVLDTNIVVSALLFAHGRLEPIRQAWQSAAFTPLVSTATTGELLRVLSYPKFKLNAAERDELLGDYLPFCTVVNIPAKAPRVPACRDPWDLPFLQLAACGKARYLVTGDRDLLEIRERLSYEVVTADAFVSAVNLRK
jgi:putative PIN family toxin of toxin-antitoxin system